MAEISIRNVPELVYAALTEKAATDGKNLETWLREQLILLVSQPVVKRAYKLRATSEDGAMATIMRMEDARAVHVSTAHCSQQQQHACQKAVDAVKRNEAGDREQAIALLRSVFEEVFELPR